MLEHWRPGVGSNKIARGTLKFMIELASITNMSGQGESVKFLYKALALAKNVNSPPPKRSRTNWQSTGGPGMETIKRSTRIASSGSNLQKMTNALGQDESTKLLHKVLADKAGPSKT